MGSGGTSNFIRHLSAVPAIVLLAASLASAMPRGEINTWLESRYYRYGPYNREISIDNLIFHSDGQLLPANRGVWHYWGDFTRESGEAYIAGNDIPSSWGRFNLRGGDYGLTFSRENILRREFRQNVLIRGGGLSLHRRRWGLALDVGSITERSSLLGVGRDNRNTLLGTARVNGSFNEHGQWAAQLAHQDDSPEGIPGRSVGEVFLGSVPKLGLALMSEARFSRANGGASGTSLVGGVDYHSDRAALGGHLRRVSEGFTGLGLQRDPHINEFGGRLQASMRAGRELLGGLILDWGRDLNDRTPGLPPEERFLARLHLSAGITGPGYVQGYLNYRNRTTNDPDSLLVDQHTFSGRGEIGLRMQRVQAAVSYGRGLFRNTLDDANDWHEDRIDLRLYSQLYRGIRTEFQGRFSERRLPDGTWASREKRGEVRLYLEGSYDRRVWVSAGRERQDATVDDFSHENWLLGMGLDFSMPAGLSISMDGYSAHDVEGIESGTFRWNARLAKRFSFGGGRLRGQEQVEEFGRVTGMVYADLNGNGVRDKDEPGIPDQLITLASGPAFTTGEDGRFEFDRAGITLDNLIFHKTHLPAKYLTPDDHIFDLRLRAGEHEEINIPVQLSSSLGGRVIYTDPQGVEHPVPGILLRVVGSHRDAFTDDAGRFVISGLSAGEATVEIVDWSLPEDFKVEGKSTQTVRMQAGEAVRLADINLVHVPKSTIQWYRQE